MKYGQCFLCGKWGWLETHHIFGASNRKKSEKFGLKVGLCGIECHRDGPKAVHRCAETAQKLHEYGQRKYMREHRATIEEFISVFGKNYLDEPYELEGTVRFEQAKNMLDEMYSTDRLAYHEYSFLWDVLDEGEKKVEEEKIVWTEQK